MKQTHWAVLDEMPCGTHFITTDGRHPKDCGHPLIRVAKLDRAPTEHDTFDGKNLVPNPDSKGRAERNAMLAHMSRAELVDHILDLVAQRTKPEQ